MTRLDRPKPKGLRRLERWGVGILMGVIAFVLEKVVMRSIRRSGGDSTTTDALATKITTKGGEVDVEQESES
jgi:hypothetical protein